MKFLFIAPRYHMNLHYRLQALTKNSQKVHFLAMYRGKSEDYSIVEPEILGYSWCFKVINKLFNKNKGRLMKNDFELRYSHPGFFKLFWKIKQAKADVLVIKNIQSIMSIFALVIGRLMRKKIIVLLQIDKYRPKAKSYSIDMVGKLFGAKVVTPRLGDRQYKNKNRNLFYIPFAVNTDDFNKIYFVGDKINIMSIGKLQERKGHLVLAQAINVLKNKFDFKVTIIGEEDEDVYTRQLMDYIKENNLSGIIDIKLNLSHQRVTEEYKKQDLYILPSWSEAASITIAEGMSFKLPVISSDDNGTQCYVEDGVNGYIFKNRNTDDLIAKIEAIVSDKDNLQKMGQASFDIAKSNHSLDKFYESFMKLI